jgi:hypothetical protein
MNHHSTPQSYAQSKPFTIQDDQKILNAVRSRQGSENVAWDKLLPGRTAKHCRERWESHLRAPPGCSFKPTKTEAAKRAMKHPKLHYDFEKVDGTGDFLSRAKVNENARQGDLNLERGENLYAISLDKKQCTNCGQQQSYKELCDRVKTCTTCGTGKYACWTGRTDSLGFTDRMSDYQKHVSKKTERLAISLRKEVSARTELETQTDRRYRNLLTKQHREKGVVDFIDRMYHDDQRRREDYNAAFQDAQKLDIECTFKPSMKDKRKRDVQILQKFAAVYHSCDPHKLHEVSINELREAIDDARLELSKHAKGGAMPLSKEEVEQLLWVADRTGSGMISKANYQRAIVEKFVNGNQSTIAFNQSNHSSKDVRVGFAVKLIAADSTFDPKGLRGSNVPEGDPPSKSWRVIYLPLEERIDEETTVAELKTIVCKHYRSGTGPVYEALRATALGGEMGQLDYVPGRGRARHHVVTEESIGICTSLGVEAGEMLRETTLLGAVQADMGSDRAVEGPMHEEAVRMLTLHLSFR